MQSCNLRASVVSKLEYLLSQQVQYKSLWIYLSHNARQRAMYEKGKSAVQSEMSRNRLQTREILPFGNILIHEMITFYFKIWVDNSFFRFLG